MLRKTKAVTPSLRHKIYLNNNLETLTNKNLSIARKKTGGRNHTGQITTRHIGGGHKQRIKLIDQSSNIGTYTVSKITKFIYDPNRNNYLMLCKTNSGKEFLKLAIENLNIGDTISGKYSPNKQDLSLGSITNLKNISEGSKISNIQLNENKGGVFIKAAGTYGIIIKQENNLTSIKLPSKKIISINSKNLCTIGANSNTNFQNKILGKAGAKRWLGIRPTVRGEAMNPIDHPHGGETSGGVRLKTVYGKLAKFIKKT